MAVHTFSVRPKLNVTCALPNISCDKSNQLWVRLRTPSTDLEDVAATPSATCMPTLNAFVALKQVREQHYEDYCNFTEALDIHARPELEIRLLQRVLALSAGNHIIW
jgi:hypothetical protein